MAFAYVLLVLAFCFGVLLLREGLRKWCLLETRVGRCKICHCAGCLPVEFINGKREDFQELLPGRDSREAYCDVCLNAILEAARDALQWRRDES